jgi:hypothetical protein
LVISVCLYMLSAGFYKDGSRRVNNKTASVDFELRDAQKVPRRSKRGVSF